MTSPLLAWLDEHTAGWKPSIVGVFREEAPHEWLITAISPTNLRTQLIDSGHLIPLPSEPDGDPVGGPVAMRLLVGCRPSTFRRTRWG